MWLGNGRKLSLLSLNRVSVAASEDTWQQALGHDITTYLIPVGGACAPLRPPLVPPLPCSVWLKPWKECLDYYVLGLQFSSWFLTEESCQRCLAHWNAREKWFNLPCEQQPDIFSEIWHGSRFGDLSYFWDSSQETLLPQKCPLCAHIVPVSEISGLIDPLNPLELITLKCSSYAQSFSSYQIG